MKSYKLLLGALALSSLSLTGCRDDFQEMNMSPTQITTADPSFLFAQAVNVFEPVAYLEYYYNAPFKYAWSGMGLMSGGASESLITMTATGDQGGQYVKTLRIARDMEAKIEHASDEDKLVWEPYLAATNVLTVYLGIFDTDMNGDIPFTEACRAAYGGTLTPAYDSVQSLYDLWLTQLDEAIAAFNKADANMRPAQDVVYGGDMSKWAKLANSLKLRIAVRLQGQDMAKAKAIAAAVASKPYIDSLDDDMLFNKAKTGSGMDDYIYHWSNGFYGMTARKGVMDFMLANKDPRVRFFYKKNSWNSKVVQEFWNQGREIPPFIEANVNFHVGADGKKVFDSWGGMGEPWVRYYGMTEEYDAGLNVTEENKWYFPSAWKNSPTETTIYGAGDKNPTQYTAVSGLAQQMIIGRNYSSAAIVSAATLPDDAYTFTTEGRPWYGMYIGTAEVNLYLAEFAMLNGNEAQAEAYYNKALRASVQEFDKLASLNQIAYYSNVPGCFGYDPNEGKIDLKDGEIDTMMASTAGYDFTGTAAEKLEKIYLQEMLHFTLYPNEVFVTARRSGYPSFNSKLLPRVDYAQVPVSKIPRRFPTGTPDDTDLMAPMMKAAWQAQGLTMTSSGLYFDCLATERLWADKNNPAWGAGK